MLKYYIRAHLLNIVKVVKWLTMRYKYKFAENFSKI